MDLQTELNHSAGQGDLTQVRAQLQDLKNRNMIPNKIIYSSLIHSSVQGGHTTSAIHLLGDFQKELYYEADAALFDPILAQLIRKSEIRAAEDLWETAKQHAPDGTLYSRMILGNIKIRSYPRAFALVDELFASRVPVEPRMFYPCMHELSQQGQYGHMIRLWKAIRSHRAPVDQKLFNFALRANAYSWPIWKRSLRQIEKEMREEDIPFDQTTFQYLIGAYSRIGEVNKTLRLCEEMRILEVPLDGVMFRDLMFFFTKHQRTEHAEQLLLNNDVNSFTVSHRQAGFEQLLCAFARQGDLERLSFWLKEMKNRNIPMDSSLHLRISLSLLEGGDAAEAQEYFASCQPSCTKEERGEFLNALAQHYADNGVISLSKQTIAQLRTEGLEVKLQCFMKLYCAYLGYQRPEEAASMAQIIQSDYRPSLEDCILLVDTFIQQADQEQARHWIDYMCECDFYPSRWYKEEKHTGRLVNQNSQRPLGQVKMRRVKKRDPPFRQ